MEMERVHQIAENADIAGEDAAAGGGGAVRSNFPDQMRRRYDVYLTLPAAHKVQAMRSVTSHDLGALIKIKARPWPLFVFSSELGLGGWPTLCTAAQRLGDSKSKTQGGAA